MLKKQIYKFTMLENEYWWGGASFDGVLMPFDKTTNYERNLDPNCTANQAAPLLLSSKGRYIWSDYGFYIQIKNSEIILHSSKGEPKLYDGFVNLKGAYIDACNNHFPPKGKRPPDEFFVKPQFNTWIEMTYYQYQDKLLEYAENLYNSGYPCSVFMIDCGWAPYYGNWIFDKNKFYDPKKFVDRLHEMGYKVMLWTCPFVTADTLEYRYCRDNNLLIMDKNGEPSIKKWWDGYSAVLDFTNPKTQEWYYAQNDKLLSEYHIDGFKFDAGDAWFYSDDDVTYSNIDANGESEIWSKIGQKYDFNEYRACWKCGLDSVVQRLCDKLHQWDFNGILSLVPCELAQGIIGSPYSCPDMVGGGDYLDFSQERMKNLDKELFVRYAQNAALMPMIQFSAAPWRVLDAKHNKFCLDMAQLHVSYADKIIELADNAKNTGEPIVRYMEYVFPNEGLEKIIDQFMLGNNILVAPINKQNATSRTVILPKGKWQFIDGTIFEGGQSICVKAELEILPIFNLIK